MLEQASEEIVGEISRSIEYYQSTGYMEEIHEELAEISREYIEILQDGQVIFL